MRAKIILLGSLYLAQGLPYGFFTQALPVLLREQGLSLPLIGLANMLAFPWALKFVWAPLVDRVETPRGRRRAVIIPLQITSVCVLAGLAVAASPDVMWLLLVGVLAVNFLAATQDIATDALAVEILSPAERGLGNGLQVGAYCTGVIIGGGAILVLFSHAGWTTAFLALAALIAATTVPIVRFREPPTRERPPRRSPYGAVRESLTRQGMLPWIVVLMTFKTGAAFASGMLRVFLKDHGQSLDDIAVMIGLFGSGAAIIGGLVGGAMTSRVRRRTALVAFGTLEAFAIGGFVLAALMPSQPMFYAVTIAENMTSTMATATLFTMMMDASRPGAAGTDFTVQASISVVCSGVASVVSGVSAHAFGYAGHFAVATAMAVIGTIIAWRVHLPNESLASPTRVASDGTRRDGL